MDPLEGPGSRWHCSGGAGPTRLASLRCCPASTVARWQDPPNRVWSARLHRKECYRAHARPGPAISDRAEGRAELPRHQLRRERGLSGTLSAALARRHADGRRFQADLGRTTEHEPTTEVHHGQAGQRGTGIPCRHGHDRRFRSRSERAHDHGCWERSRGGPAHIPGQLPPVVDVLESNPEEIDH